MPRTEHMARVNGFTAPAELLELVLAAKANIAFYHQHLETTRPAKILQ